MRRAVIASALSIAVLLGFGVYGAQSNFGASKPGATGLPEGARITDPPPIPGEPIPATPAGFTVPASTQPRAEQACPSGWRAFDNPVGHFALCYPHGWGFSEFRTSSPLTELRSVSLGNIHLLSADAFPWTPGDRLFETIGARNLIDVEVDVVPLDTAADAANPVCAPASRVVAGSVFKACEDTYDLNGIVRAPGGPFHVLRVSIPLISQPLRTQPYSEQPSSLLLVVRSTTSRYQEEANLIWQLVRSVTPY